MRGKILLGAAIMVAGMASACGGPSIGGSFDRTLNAGEATRLELVNGSGPARITAGAPGQVHIHGDFLARAWPWGNARQLAEQITQNPPIRQSGGLIAVGFDYPRFGGVSFQVNYIIEVPPDTQVHTICGSGNATVAGIAGPVDMTTGSGNLTASQIQGDVHANTGSGDIRLAAVQGEAEVRAGSGEVDLREIRGEVRVTAGSSDITITGPGSSIEVFSGSGDIHVNGASDDVRVHTGSGNMIVAGLPSPGAYWDIHTASGSVTLNVPASASFRFYATTHLGEIHSDLPLTIEESSRRALRAVAGQGSARVEVATISGDIQLHSRQQ